MLSLVCEIVFLIDGLQGEWIEDEEIEGLESSTDPLRMLHRLLPKKKIKKSGGTVSVITDYGNLDLATDVLVKQFIRVIHSSLIMCSFLKLLNVAQVYPSIGYLVKMVGKVGVNSV